MANIDKRLQKTLQQFVKQHEKHVTRLIKRGKTKQLYKIGEEILRVRDVVKEYPDVLLKLASRAKDTANEIEEEQGG